jgi:hypothetical protein
MDGVAYAVGPGGLALALRSGPEGVTIEIEKVVTHRDLSAVAVDPTGVAWAAARGRLLKRVASYGVASWEAVHSYEWLVPAIGVNAAGGSVFACTVDGAVLEGRDEKPAIAAPAPSITPPPRSLR